jgi:Dehydrogenases with different specificities (related to short-chain alcohol dehydrogenases)
MTDPILITGGATRLGYALAMHYINNAQPVVITYRSQRPEVDKLKAAGVTCVHADFATDSGVLDALESLKSVMPRCQSIVHNASSWWTDPPLADQLDHLALMMRIHVGTPMVLTHGLEPALEAADNPSVILVSDHVAHRGSDKHMAYAASKAAMLNLTQSLAKRYAPTIRVNALCPALLAFRDEDDDAYRAKTLKKSPLGRVPGFDVAIQGICYLQTNQYTTGTILPLDGGRSLNMP